MLLKQAILPLGILGLGVWLRLSKGLGGVITVTPSYFQREEGMDIVMANWWRMSHLMFPPLSKVEDDRPPFSSWKGDIFLSSGWLLQQSYPFC